MSLGFFHFIAGGLLAKLDLQMKFKNIRRSKIYVITLLFINLIVQANSTTTPIIEKKADFILEIASMIKFPESPPAENYKLGFLGKGRDVKLLIDELRSRGELTVQGKTVEFFNFRKMRNVTDVDLLYVPGNSKANISELSNKLSGYPHNILTEDFPFGTSILNFTIDENRDLFFEIQEKAIQEKGAIIDNRLLSSSNRIKSGSLNDSKLQEALSTIKKYKKTIQKKDEEIEEKVVAIEEKAEEIQVKANEIEEKTEEIRIKSVEIEEQRKIITLQRTVIILAISGVLIISLLGIILLKVNRQRKIALNDVMDSINYARHIQKAILPSQNLLKESFHDSFILYRPKNIVSGDFYWVEAENDKIFFTVADCTGHGVPGAILSVMCNNYLTKTVKELKVDVPAKILDKTNELVENTFAQSEKEVKDGMELALCSLDLKRRKLEFAGARNPLYIIQNGELDVIKPDRQPIGKYIYRDPYTNHELDVKAGDCIYVFSDGYADQFGGTDNKKFSYKRLRKTLLDIHEKPMEQQKELLNQTLEHWMKNEKQIDDICIMGIRI